MSSFDSTQSMDLDPDIASPMPVTLYIMIDETKEQYFYIADPDVKMVMWGKNVTQDDIEEAIPVAIFPQAVTDEIVKDFFTLLTVKDPEGTIGKGVKAFIEGQLKQMEEGPELQGVKPGEDIPAEELKEETKPPEPEPPKIIL